MTFGYRVYCALAQWQTINAIASTVEASHSAVYDALLRLLEQGFVERIGGSRGRGHAAHWRQTGKVMPDKMLCSAAQLANLRKGPRARAEKYRGKRRPPEVAAKISVSKRILDARRRYEKLGLPKTKCLLQQLWRGV